MNTLADLIAYLAADASHSAAAPTGIEESHLAALETEATAVFAASRSTSTPDLAAGRAAMAIRAWRAAAMEHAAELAAMDAAFAPAPETAAVAPVVAAVPTSVVIPEVTVVETVVVPAAVTAAVTLAEIPVNADGQPSEAAIPARRTSVVAARGQVFETARPDDMYDTDRAVAALSEAVARVASVSSPNGGIPFIPVLREVAYNLPENDRLTRLNDRMDPRRAAAQIEANDQDQRIVSVEKPIPYLHSMRAAGLMLPTSRTAAVFCGPTANSFDVGVIPKGGSPIYDSFPKDPSSRGKFRFRPSIGLSTFGSINIDHPGVPWDPDTNTGTQSGSSVDCTSSTVCYTPGCLNDEIQVNMKMWKICFDYQNTAEIVDPEGLRAQMELWSIAQDRQREFIMMAYLQACSQLDLAYYSWTETTTNYGGIPDFLRVLAVVLGPAGWTGRYDGAAGYTLYIPDRVATWMALDELSRVQVSTDEGLKTAVMLMTNPTAVFDRFMPGLRVVTYIDDPTFSATFTVPVSGDPAPAPTSVAIKPLGAATHSILNGAGPGASVTPVVLPDESIQTFRIWLSPTADQRVADTGVTEIGPDRVTRADCDIVRLNRWERWVPYRRAEGKKTYAVDMTLAFNGARASGVTPY